MSIVRPGPKNAQCWISDLRGPEMRIGLDDRISALMARLISLRNSRAPGTAGEKEMHLFIFCYFISFALKNTKKKT